MRKLALLLVGGLLIFAACVPTTPGPLNIPETGSSPQPGVSGTAGPGGSSLTIVPPGSADPGVGAGTTTASQGGAGQAAGTWTPVPGTEDMSNAWTATANANNAGQGAGNQGQGPSVTGTPSAGGGTGGNQGSGQTTTTPGAGGSDSGIPKTDPQPTDQVPPTTNVVTDYNYSDFLGELRGQSGLTIEERGQVQEPFFNVSGQQVRINNADVTIFEFPDAQSHQAALNTITANGGIIGAITPYWTGRPNFYSKGNLIALYIGSDQATLDLLTERFGEPLTYTGDFGGLNADTAWRIQSRLSDLLNVGLDQIRIVDVSQQNWPDACLGLGGANESCAKVTTPGYSVTVEVGGTRYNVRTNQSASLLRFQQQ